MEWRPIPNYEGLYEIAHDGIDGIIRSISCKGKGKGYSRKGGIIYVYLNRSGYKCVGLSKNGKRKHFKVHRLIAQVFIPNPENKSIIDHINRIRTDNRLENLRWATIGENNINTCMRKDNTTGLKNITKMFRKGMPDGYIVQINRNKVKYAKRCKTEEDAIAWRNAMYDELDG